MNSTNDGAPVGAILTRDLMFGPSVVATASSLGHKVQQVASVDRLLALAGEHALRCVILDLSGPIPDIDELVPELTKRNVATVIGFDSHVRGASLKAAREAGCTEVLPRSRFSENLQTNLNRWLG